MNALCYKIVFSKRLGTLVAVGEHTASQGKAAGTGVRTVVFPSSSAASADNFVGLLKSVFASVALSFVTVGYATAAGPAVNTLPTGYSVNSGNVAISSTSSATNAAMTIKQTTDKASVNWNSFSIGSGAAVNVQQNNANSVLLNRVVGNDPSQIFGKLTANGQVILINPNGVVFGKDGRVTASAFTASTFGMTDADFNNSKHKFTRNGSTAGVTVEEGATIDTTGYVALMGASVDNQGAITTKGGPVVLASGESVTLPSALTDNISVPLSGKVRLELLPSNINAMVANSGTITTEGGQVLMQAAALSDAVASVTHAGVINTTGAQGGAVSLLSDSGIIKVSGAIKANSTDASNKGGDIIIGRDTESGVLAKSTDVSGAKLESNKGFVETSGDHIKTDGITVKAKEWLLDPTDITIVATGTATADTASSNASGTTTFQDNTAVATSEVLKSTIESAINGGTNVTIKTTNTTTGATGAGNITIATALTFNNTGATDATLSLIADNGITQNSGASITTNAASTKLVNVTMTANGNFQGNTAASTSSQGITLNAGITTNGNVTLTGTNKNTNGGSRGVNFNNGSGITANTITVTGTATGAAEWNQGVLFSGTSSFKSTGSSVISGISSSTAGAINSAVVFNDGSSVTLDAGTGSLTVQGTHTVNGYGGIRFGTYGGSSTNPSLTTKGNVTLGTQDASNTSLNAGFMLRGGLITADTGSLTIKGQATGTGINLYDGYGTIKSNRGAITLNGVATTSGHGVYFNSNQVGTLNSGGDVTIIGSGKGGNQGVQFNGGNVRVYGNNVTINGTANTASGQTGYGFYSTIGPGSGNTITAAGNLSITGALNGAGSGTAVFHTSTNWQNLVNAYTAGGSLSITGTNNASASNTGTTITMAGVQASAVGDLTVSATANNAAADAISVFSNSYLSGVPAPGYQGGASSFVSTGGNTTLKSNQGSIFIQDGVPNSVTSTAITGKNVIIDNTGGTFTGGVFTAGSGTSTSTTRAGVQISDGLAASDLYLSSNPILRTITASDAAGQIVLSGKSTGSASGYSVGVRIASTTSYMAPTTNLLGTSTASVGVYNTAAITTSKDLNITGVSSSQTNQQGGVTLNGAITTGAAGKVNITATDTAGGSNWAYNQNAGANINAGTGGVTINATGSGANSALDIYGNITTTGAISLTGNAGTGGGNGIWTSGTVGISGTSVTMNGTGGTTGGAGTSLSSGTTLTASSGDVSITGSKPSSASTAAINLAGTINGVSAQNIILTGGLTGAGSIVTNGAAVNLNNTLTAVDNFSGVISGTGGLHHQTGNQTLSGTNTYSGATTVNGGTLQVGNGGSTGSLGTTTGVTLSNNATLSFNKNVNTTIDKAISGNGNVTATITGDLALTSNIALTGTNTINLTASGAITETAGTLAATNLYLTATNGAIGAVGNRIQSNVTNLSFSAGSNAYLTEANAVTVSGRTTANNGNIDIVTTNGTMSIGSVNSINGITAHGTGNITIAGNASTGHGISINNTITATNGDVNLTGRTSSTVNYNAGVFSQSTVAAKNITMVAESTSTTGSLLGYYGAGGVFNASQQLSLTGISNSFANGLYSYTGSYLSGTGMTLVGSSIGGQGMGFDRAMTVTNSTSGGINITGTATDSTKQAIGFQGVAITNGGGALAITANNGKIYSGTGDAAWGAAQTNTITNNGTGSVQITAGNGSATNSGSIDGSVFTITQNGNAGVVVTTSGTGNVTAPKIINAGTGDIVVAAGTLIAAGTATGGQVLTVTDNTLTQTNAAPGKTYVYSGSADATGALSKLSTSFNSLYYEGTSQALNTGFNTAFDSNHANDLAAPTGGSVGNTQAFFRSTSMPGFTLALNSLNKTYGDSDTTLSTTSAATLTNTVAGIGGSNTFAVTTADVMAGLSRAAGENVGSYAYSWSGSNFNTTITGGFPSLTIGQRDITLATLTAANRSYDGTTNASITGATFGNIANGETLGLTGSGTFDTQNFGSGKTVTVSDVTALTHSSSGTGLWANYHLTTTGSKTTTANISQAALVVTATQVTKEYDGTTTATSTGTVATLAGAGAGELVNNAGVQVFTNPNAGAGNKTVQASGVTIKDAANNDVTANYNISYTDNTTSTITPAPLTIKVNNTAMFVTQDARAALDQGFTYTGFKNGETVATAITGGGLTPADRTYTGASNFPVAGSYTGVYGASAPNSVNGNYAITMQTGNLTVVPADKLLITIASQTDTYSNRTANNAGYVSGNNVTAQYCFVASNCAGANLVNLTVTQQSGNQWKAADNTGSFVVFDTTLLTPSYSTGGFLQAGNYTFSASEITPLLLPNGNFTGRYTNGGVLTIAPLAATLSTNGITKTYDGTTAVSAVAISPSNLAAGDVVSANASTGSFASRDAANGIVLSLSNLSLAGTDAANYYLSSNSLVGTGDITPKAITLTGTSVANKQYDGNTNATILTAGNLSSLVGSETLTLNGLSGTFSSPTVGFNKAVTLAATLQNGTNGGLAGNYTLGASTAYADITQVKDKDPSPIVVPPKPIIPTDNSSESGGSSGGGSSAGNPYLLMPVTHPNNAGRCTPNTLEDCLCETQEPRPLEGIAICYQPKKTASTTPVKGRRS
jgi:filamentous hemagglutinin family protein